MFRPDEHLLLAEDGYRLALLPHLAWRAELAPREQARLQRLLGPEGAARREGPGEIHFRHKAPERANDEHFFANHCGIALDAGQTALAEALEAEPFWHAGRARLCRALAQTNPAAALPLVWEATHFDPGPEPLQLLAQVAARLGDQDLSAQAQAALQAFPPPAPAEALRAFRAFLRRFCPELMSEADALLAVPLS